MLAVLPLLNATRHLAGDAPGWAEGLGLYQGDMLDSAARRAYERMLVDAVHEVVAFAAGDIEAVPALGTKVSAEFLTGMARIRGEIVPLLDTQRVLLLDNDDKLSVGSRAICFAKRTLEIWDRLELKQAA